jgi:hypothetical protein
MKNIFKLKKKYYITSAEEIKKGDWFLSKEGIVHNNFWGNFGDKKIILTDNKDLIADGLQAIDDEFLVWLVKNPSCERVEVVKGKMQLNDDGQEYGFPDMSLYKIIIPQKRT